jgi:putative pyruvate formate lyase activating enzyme
MTSDLIRSRILRIQEVLPELLASMKNCGLCPRQCHVDRSKGEMGFCRAPAEPVVYRHGEHHGEEPPLSGKNGSGTIFFSHCNMGCVYCQNSKFSHKAAGKRLSVKKLSEIMLDLQYRGCHNINLVSPTHFVPVIVEALELAYKGGLNIPIVYNTGGYDDPRVIGLLDGIVDVYLPDMRYSSDEMAVKYSIAPGYVENNRIIVKEMLRQVGILSTDENGIARKGLIVRLLALPNNVSGMPDTLDFISADLSKCVHLSVMSQYYPAHNALTHSDIARRVNASEFKVIMDKLEMLHLHNGWVQPLDGDFDEDLAGENFLPSV